MPVYVYGAKDARKSCRKCRDGFEISQRLSDAKLERCPFCRAEVQRIIQAPALGHSETDLNYRAKRAGFHAMKRIGSGEYEKMY